jgi:hypothetical protein
VIPVIDLVSGFTLEIMGALGMADTVLRSKDPSLASVTIAIHSAMAQAVEELWASAPSVNDTTLGSLYDFQQNGVRLLGSFRPR